MGVQVEVALEGVQSDVVLDGHVPLPPPQLLVLQGDVLDEKHQTLRHVPTDIIMFYPMIHIWGSKIMTPKLLFCHILIFIPKKFNSINGFQKRKYYRCVCIY